MRTVQEGVKVSILGREFSVACPDDQRDALIAAASYLDNRMREIQRSGKVMGVERCAIMAALNITHELLSLREQTTGTVELETRVQSLARKIESAMQEQANLNL